MAIIKVGATTETEMKEKKARVEDAMHATKAAVEEGIVPGGGVALLRAARVLETLQVADDERVGVAIVRRAIEEPMRWIAANAGHEGSIVVQRVKDMQGDEGFNAQTERYEDLVQAGVIDPTKVVRSAIQNAASIASLLLTTEAVISQLPDAGGERGRRRNGRHVLRRVMPMLIDITRARAIEGWVAAVALAFAVTLALGVRMTMTSGVLLLALGLVPPAIALLLWPVGHAPAPIEVPRRTPGPPGRTPRSRWR